MIISHPCNEKLSNYLLDLPSEVLNEIENNLSIKDQRFLHSTNCKIRYLKIQEFLEKLDHDLFKRQVWEGGYSTPLPASYFKFLSEAKSLENGSEDRCQALRNAICSVFKGSRMVCLQNLFCLNPLYNDKPLSIQLLTNHSDVESLRWYENDKANGKFVVIIYKLLAENQLNLKKVKYIQEFEIPTDERIIKLFVTAISNNLSVNEVILSGALWNLEQLKGILEAINKNERIGQVSIVENDPVTPSQIEKVRDVILNTLNKAWVYKSSSFDGFSWTYSR